MRRWCPCCRAVGRCPLWWWRRDPRTSLQTRWTQRTLRAWSQPRCHALGTSRPDILNWYFHMSLFIETKTLPWCLSRSPALSSLQWVAEILPPSIKVHGANLQPAAGAPADHPGEIHRLQVPGDFLPAQVSRMEGDRVVSINGNGTKGEVQTLLRANNANNKNK